MNVSCPRCLTCLLVLFALFASGATPLPAEPLGPEFPVNSFTTGKQANPTIAADSAGKFVVVWESAEEDGSFTGIFAQRFSSAGTPAGGEIQVNSYTTDFQFAPRIATDGTDQFVVSWMSYGQDGSYWGVFGQRFDSAGEPLGVEFQVNSYITMEQRDPAVAVDSSGSFVVVWESNFQDGSSYGVFGQRFDSNGSPAGSEFRVNSYTTGQQLDPAVAATGSGTFVVVWAGSGQDSSGSGVFAQRLDATGSKVGGEFRVNSHTTGNQQTPAVTADGAGNFVVAWRSEGQDGPESSVFAQRFDSTGNTIGGEFRVNSYTTSSQKQPVVAADSAGNFVVTWSSYLQDDSGYGIFGKHFDPSGNSVGSEFQINSYTTGYQWHPAIAAHGADNFVVAWEDDREGLTNYELFGRQLTTKVFSDQFESGSVCFWSQSFGSSDVCF